MYKKLDFNFEEDNEIIKTELYDGVNSLIVNLSIYMIGGKWYLDIYSDTKEYELGKLITRGTDLFEISKFNNREFPKVELQALAINELGVTTDFSLLSTMLDFHGLFLVTKEGENE